MTLQEIKSSLDQDISKQLVPARALLGQFRFIDEASRNTGAYSDPTYIPFYYHLGKYLKPRNFLEIGFRLALFSGNFMRSCQTVEYFLGFQKKTKEYYTPRLGMKNLRLSYKGKADVHVGDILDEAMTSKLKNPWDLVIINEEAGYDKQLYYLETVWPLMRLDGFLVCDYVESNEASKRAFGDFCKIKNRQPVTFETRYGVGIVQR